MRQNTEDKTGNIPFLRDKILNERQWSRHIRIPKLWDTPVLGLWEARQVMHVFKRLVK